MRHSQRRCWRAGSGSLADPAACWIGLLAAASADGIRAPDTDTRVVCRPESRAPRRSRVRLARRQTRASPRRRPAGRSDRRPGSPAFDPQHVRQSHVARLIYGPAFGWREVSWLRSDLPSSSPPARLTAFSAVARCCGVGRRPAFSRVGYPFASGSPAEDAGKTAMSAAATRARPGLTDARAVKAGAHVGGMGPHDPETSETTGGRTIRHLSQMDSPLSRMRARALRCCQTDRESRRF